MPRKRQDDDDAEDPKAPEIQGSKPLANFKHERFANFLTKGFTVVEAWKKLGYADHVKNGYRLKKAPHIVARTAYLLEQAAKKTIVDASYIKDRLARVVELALVTEINDQGQEVLGPTGNLAAASRALELLGREQGIFKDKIELGGQVSVGNREIFEKMSAEERAAFKGLLLQAAARSPRPANDDRPQEQESAIAKK